MKTVNELQAQIDSLTSRLHITVTYIKGKITDLALDRGGLASVLEASEDSKRPTESDLLDLEEELDHYEVFAKALNDAIDESNV